MKIFYHFGRYYMLMGKAFSRMEKFSVLFSQTIKEIDKLGINSLGIVIIISVFSGAVITLQTAVGMDNPLLPRYLIGLTARESMLLELASTMVSLILAGKVGSNVASELGTMRVTEQIDALEIMGINSANYLIAPKIIATMFINPFLVIIGMFLGIVGGWIVGTTSGLFTSAEYVFGVQYDFKPFYVFYALIKTVVFAFILTSVSAYQGYHVRGGALEVGRSSTKAVVYSSLLILLFNTIITKLLLI